MQTQGNNLRAKTDLATETEPSPESGEIRASTTIFWFYFIAFTSAELLTVFLHPLTGVICHGLTLGALLIQSALSREARRSDLMVSLSLVPLVRIMSLGMPLAHFPRIYWYILIYTPLVVATVVVMLNLRLKPRQVGLVVHRLPLQMAVGIVTGVIFGTVEYYVLRPAPLVSEFSLRQIWLPAIVLFTTTGFTEEFMFRGVLQRTSEAAMGWQGIIYVSAIFAILHVGHLSAIDVIAVFFIALFFAAWVKKTGSLFGVILSHGTTNVFLYLIVPFVLT